MNKHRNYSLKSEVSITELRVECKRSRAFMKLKRKGGRESRRRSEQMEFYISITVP